MAESDPALLLRDERAAALEHLAILTATMRDVVQSAGSTTADDEHDPEGATIAFERAQVGALVDRAWERLGEIDAAAARLAGGTYGRCGRCAQPIARDRLAVRPAAALCVRCASAR